MDRKIKSYPSFFVWVTLCLLINGCATYATLPREKISEADKAVMEARESNASLHAPGELKTAEDKLAEAKEALAKKDYDKATRLAEQASVDAEYARVQGGLEKAKRKAEELHENVKTLRQEIEFLSKE